MRILVRLGCCMFSIIWPGTPDLSRQPQTQPNVKTVTYTAGSVPDYSLPTNVCLAYSSSTTTSVHISKDVSHSVRTLQDPETYIHRSGRTGRAGSTGVSVTLVDRKKEGLIPYIQKKAGVNFERIGAPQPAQMAQIAGEQTIPPG